MSDPSSENPEQNPQKDSGLYRWLELAVPLLSFAGVALGILLWITDAGIDFRISILGCLLASWVLAYLAWIRPRKDIVALSTPIYSFIFIAVPTDNFSTVILDLLYAISLTILLVRLKYRFGKPFTVVSGGKELAGSLKTYIEQSREFWKEVSPETAHNATLAFVRFAEGEYGEAARVSGTAPGQLEDTGTHVSLSHAFKIIKEHATLLDKSLTQPHTYLTFSDEDSELLAKPVSVSPPHDQKFYTTLDNALLLLFSVAWNVSERDRVHLLACQAFALKLMSST